VLLVYSLGSPLYLGTCCRVRCMHGSVRISGISNMKTVGWVYCGKCMWVILSRYLREGDLIGYKPQLT
jgi:hypothetical protein